jgi:hypothetical protein
MAVFGKVKKLKRAFIVVDIKTKRECGTIY